MADPLEDDEISWYAPDPRAVLPLGKFHVSRSLARVIRQKRFDIRVDTSFADVIRGCARTMSGRETTWISDEIVDAYTQLHDLGYAHCVESWLDGRLAGGLYGVSIGGAFFGESMFSVASDASKVALAHLIERLKAGGYVLLDTQMTTPHLERLGVVLIPKSEYLNHLKKAVSAHAEWNAIDRSQL